MAITSAIRDLIARGFSIEQALEAAEAFEDAMAPKLTARQARNARYYRNKKATKASEKRLKTSETSYSDDQDAVPPKKEKSPTPPKEKITPSSSEAEASSRCERDFFPDFWLAYPRREGPNPKKPARERFARLIAKGHDPQALVAAAQALAAEHPTPTRFVPQAQTWLNQERFEDAEPVLAGDVFCAEDVPSTRLHVLRFRNSNDGHDPPRAVQGGKAGYLIPADWVKAMDMRAANG